MVLEIGKTRNINKTAQPKECNLIKQRCGSCNSRCLQTTTYLLHTVFLLVLAVRLLQQSSVVRFETEDLQVDRTLSTRALRFVTPPWITTSGL